MQPKIICEHITGSNPVLEAARTGDVEFLQREIGNANNNDEYFLSRSQSSDGEDEYNIIQIAIMCDQAEFLKQALDRLQPSVVQILLSHKVVSWKSYNACHIAASQGHLICVQLLVAYYQKHIKKLLVTSSSSSSSSSAWWKPWLELDVVDGMTPFHVALYWRNDECALELLSLDMELLCKMSDNKGVSPFIQAVYHGCEKVAIAIMNSGYSYLTCGLQGTPLDVSPYCSEKVCEMLLDKHPEMIEHRDSHGYTFLHKWVNIGEVWPFELLLKRVTSGGWGKQFINLLCMVDKCTDNNPLHIAAANCSEQTYQITRLLVETYTKQKGQVLPVSPWRRRNFSGYSPLQIAILNKHQTLALYYIDLDFDYLVLREVKSVLYGAVWMGCDQVVQKLLTSHTHHHPLHDHPNCFLQSKSNHGQIALHVASNCSETTGRLLVEKLSGLIKEQDDNGKTPLDIASELGTEWLIKLLLIKEPSAYKKTAWVEACNRGHTRAVEAFINYCIDFRMLCFQEHDSPLHHINNLGSFNKYQEFLAIPLFQEMKNLQDSNNSTPLHRALERNDILLAEALLAKDGVSTTIQDNNGNTAINLLVQLCDQHDTWVEMCKRVRINPRLRTQYLPPNTTGGGGAASIPRAAGASSAGEMRGTLSVVAALLATLTFAAAFTLPGGLNQDTGEALLTNKASFVVFILADTYAMCCSMLVLFFLMWSMVVDDQDRSLILVDRSVLILKQSLYGTLLAFMTGVFTVISHNSMWAAIVVFVMCSLVALVAVSANTAFLYQILDNLAPFPANTTRKNQTPTLQEGIPLTSTVDATITNQSHDPPSTV